MLSRRFLLAAAAALTLAPALPAFAEEHPETFHAHDAYARTMGGIGASGAVFMMLHNNGTTDDRLIGAKTEVAAKAELHTHIMTADGVMQMVTIERGSDHVMLFGLTRELKDGDSFPLTLIFESGAELTFDVVVDNQRQTEDGMGEMNMEGQDHSTTGTGG